MKLNEHILPILLINLVNIIIGKNTELKRIFQQQFLKNCMSNVPQFEN